MFPGYLFARFQYVSQFRLVRATRGVTCIVGFGGIPSVVPEEILTELRNSLRDEETVVIPTTIQPGEEVHIIAGPFRGVRAVVTRILPARERIAILLEVLGMEREVEVHAQSVLPDIAHPLNRPSTSKI